MTIIENIMSQKVERLKLLPDSDKNVLLEALQISYGHAEACLKKLSIFIPVVEPEKIERYYFTNYSDQLYYMGMHERTDSGVFFDSDRKIAYASRHYLTHLHSFVNQIDSCLENVFGYKIGAAKDIGENFVAIEKWFYTYGHFKDEAFSIANFAELNDKFANSKLILDYPTDGHLNTSKFTFNENYQIIENLIFDQRSVNLYQFGSQILKLKNLTIIRNGFNSEAFHSFPSVITDRIASKVIELNSSPTSKKLFVTRSSSYRDIGNKAEVESFFREYGYNVVNPEDLSYRELVKLTRGASSIVMYYGSAMTNAIYLPKGARVIILKSQSYMEETLDLWSKMIKEYSLDVVVVSSKENIIDLNDITGIII